ncbi:hypothetical protein GALMADRAFT_232370 [Galerina marginata CBS 339.88]|uniref:Uncharacterized protein n=1 Tax=Galerina marginata (strain CBS 339.88) TaxID=685588 RepID=A0A067SJ57_GALM3|nr:hypothetical protein GALMADRAFT_232370 [Galerina marginata CBS 339.88]
MAFATETKGSEKGGLPRSDREEAGVEAGWTTAAAALGRCLSTFGLLFSFEFSFVPPERGEETDTDGENCPYGCVDDHGPAQAPNPTPPPPSRTEYPPYPSPSPSPPPPQSSSRASTRGLPSSSWCIQQLQVQRLQKRRHPPPLRLAPTREPAVVGRVAVAEVLRYITSAGFARSRFIIAVVDDDSGSANAWAPAPAPVVVEGRAYMRCGCADGDSKNGKVLFLEGWVDRYSALCRQDN